MSRPYSSPPMRKVRNWRPSARGGGLGGSAGGGHEFSRAHRVLGSCNADADDSAPSGPGGATDRKAQHKASTGSVTSAHQAAAKHLGQVAAQYQPDAGARHCCAPGPGAQGLEEALALLGAQARASVSRTRISTHPGSRPLGLQEDQAAFPSLYLMALESRLVGIWTGRVGSA